MMKAVSTVNAPQAIGPYSQAVRIGDFIFVSGQIHLTPDGTLVGNTIEEQTRQVMENLKEILSASGVTFAEAVKTTIYMIDISEFSKMNEVYSSYMKKPYPARETASVKELPKGARIEISMIAVKK